MAKGKTAQEIYKERKARERAERDAYLPPGLINHGNTCFMNSVLQCLISTPYLYQMVHMELPESSRSTALTNGRGGQNEQEWVGGMRLADVFLVIMEKAWRIRDLRQRAAISPKELLSVLGKKYDQYNDFRQQDAHEFLRLLLDAMRMEEFDIIKKRQPPPPKTKKTRRKSYTLTSAEKLIPPEERLVSFVDSVFTGQLASILICETCKHVSVTNEPFDDLSLSIKPDDAKERKRDRLRMFAQKFRLSETTTPPVRPQSVPPPTPTSYENVGGAEVDPRRRSEEKEMNVDDPVVAASPPPPPGRQSDEPENFGTKLSRRVSVAWSGKKKKNEQEKQSVTVVENGTQNTNNVANGVLDIRPTTQAADVVPTKPTSSRSTSPIRSKPTPTKSRSSRAESAYIRALLADTQNASPLNPFSYLPPASSMWTKFAPGQGLEQCLRQFSAVELLEGDNAVGCRRCWKIANGLYKPQIDEDDDDDDEDEAKEGPDPLPPPNNGTHFLEPMSVDYSISPSPASTSMISSGPDMNVSSLDLTSSISSLPTTYITSSTTVQEPVPIPQITTEGPNSPITPEFNNERPSVQFMNRADTADSLRAPDPYFHRGNKRRSMSSDNEGNSSEESSDELSDASATTASSQVPKSGGTPPARKRRKSKEVIMRRSYKRYLVAKPPPVLVIHLKRFQQVSKSPVAIFGNLKKLDDYVPFPEFLDLSGYLAPKPEDFGLPSPMDDAKNPSVSDESCMYRLVAIVVHIGNMLGGHYVAYTALPASHSAAQLGPERRQGSEDSTVMAGQQSDPNQSPKVQASSKKSIKTEARQWCYISDTIVRMATLDEVLKSKAYICMYERLDTVLPAARL